MRRSPLAAEAVPSSPRSPLPRVNPQRVNPLGLTLNPDRDIMFRLRVHLTLGPQGLRVNSPERRARRRSVPLSACRSQPEGWARAFGLTLKQRVKLGLTL